MASYNHFFLLFLMDWSGFLSFSRLIKSGYGIISKEEKQLYFENYLMFQT